jgi:hypothetical protein
MKNIVKLLESLVDVQTRLANHVAPIIQAQHSIDKSLQHLMEPLSELQNQMAKSLEPFIGLMREINSIQIPLPVQEAIKNISVFQEALKIHLGPIAEVARQLAINHKRCHMLEEVGWLPHDTTPFNLIDECGDNLKDLIGTYYKENWADIRSKLEKRILSFDLDEEAKATFLEALDAHEKGLYRSVCRLLFPEIERVARIELCDESQAFKPIASQHDLRELAGKLSITDIQSQGYYVFTLYEKLSDHLYAKVDSDIILKKMEVDAVPNRHASLHGRVVYSSMQNSLNTILITDYIFQIIDSSKKPAVT